MKELIKKNRLNLIINIALSLVYVLLNVFSSYSLGFFITAFQGAMPTTAEILKLFLSIFLLWTLTAVVSYIKDLHYNYLITSVKSSFRHYLADKIQAQSLEEILSKDRASYLSWFTNDTREVIRTTFVSGLEFVEAVLATLTSFIAMAIVAWPIAIAAIILFLVMAVVPQLLNSKYAKAVQNMTQASEEYTAEMESILQGLPILFSNNRKQVLRKKSTEYSVDYEKSYKHGEDVGVEVQGLSVYVSLVMQLVLFSLTSVSIVLGFSNIGALASILYLSQYFFDNVGSSVSNFMTIKSSKSIWEKYENLSSESEKAHKGIGDLQTLETHDLAFAYDAAKTLVYPDIRLEKGKKYLLSGANGSGKSTLLKLLAGFYTSYEGEIVCNSKYQIRDIDTETLWEQITYMFQDPYLFSDSIRNNLSLWDGNISDADIYQALDQVGLKNFTQDLPGALDYNLSENAKNLSGGQKQRLVLARALLHKTPYIFIDEATANIDAKSKEIILNEILNLENTCVLMVDHSLQAEETSVFDKVINID